MNVKVENIRPGDLIQVRKTPNKIGIVFKINSTAIYVRWIFGKEKYEDCYSFYFFEFQENSTNWKILSRN